MLLAFLFSAFFGVGVAVLSDVLDNTIRDPDQVARLMNTEVIGSLPAVKDWRRRLSPIHPTAIGHVPAACSETAVPCERPLETARPQSRSADSCRRRLPGALEL